jgi:hypothetical protein
MTLPDKKTTKKRDLRDFTILLYGLPKIGKSTACSRIEDALFIPTEAGLKSLEVYATDQVTSWTHFLEIAAEVAKNNKKFKTLVIDTVSNLYQMCEDYVVHREGCTHVSKVPDKAGYGMVRIEFKRAITKLAALGTGLVLIGHSKEETIKTRTSEYTKSMLDMSDKARVALVGEMDVTLFATISRDKDGNPIRVVRSTNSETHEAGDRTGLFEDGMLLEDLFTTTNKGGIK